MPIKIFKDKKIIIRKLLPKDIKQAKKFQLYLNSLIGEDAKILMKTKKSEKEEREWLKDRLKNIKKHKSVSLLAEHNGKIVGLTSISLGIERQDHIGNFAISIDKEYRSIGLGTYLMKSIIKSAKKELKPKIKIIKLEVFVNNKPAIHFYKKMGFKQVASIPKQIQYKGKLIPELVMLLYL